MLNLGIIFGGGVLNAEHPSRKHTCYEVDGGCAYPSEQECAREVRPAAHNTVFEGYCLFSVDSSSAEGE